MKIKIINLILYEGITRMLKLQIQIINFCLTFVSAGVHFKGKSS